MYQFVDLSDCDEGIQCTNLTQELLILESYLGQNDGSGLASGCRPRRTSRGCTYTEQSRLTFDLADRLDVSKKPTIDLHPSRPVLLRGP